MRVRSPGQEDPLEEDMATHSSSLAWRIPVARGALWVTVYRVAKSGTQLKRLSLHTHIHSYKKCIPPCILIHY